MQYLPPNEARVTVGGLSRVAQMGNMPQLVGQWRQQRQDWRAARPQWQGFEGTRPEFREARQEWRSQRPTLSGLAMPYLGGQ